MTNELLIFTAKVLGAGATFFILNAIIYSLVEKGKVVYPKDTYVLWMLIPWMVTANIVSSLLENHFPETGYWMSSIYGFFLMLPFLTLSLFFIKKRAKRLFHQFNNKS